MTDEEIDVLVIKTINEIMNHIECDRCRHRHTDMSVGGPALDAIRSAIIAARTHGQTASDCPEHPTGRVVDDDGKRICSTCGR